MRIIIQKNGQGGMPWMRFREIERIILEDGWYLVKQKGSHHHYKHPKKEGKVTIPKHVGDINPDTVKSILRQAGLSSDLSIIYIRRRHE